ncbi:conserved unknown protein [Ectocarpus siliculosus]|uniref:Uncharacterized protein n=1 Tax=Ectocarpus siliculosus TaxID=2880 RepID=D7FZA9_ECTSI|nr:conserved unknown protein [Ectocarpus siliculosus]|eukprot:CBJ32726.1 conserved unknown protein [Ectocarpus siliculosus]
MLYMDPDGGGGGHGGMEAIRALAEGFGIDLPMGREVDVDTAFIEGATKRMALHDPDAGHWSLRVFMTNKEQDGVRVGSESDVVDYVEERINLSLAELAINHDGDDPTSTGDDVTTGDDVKPPNIDIGCDTEFSDSTTAPPSLSSSRGDVTPDLIPEPSSPTSSRASWASHPWDDDEYWGDDQIYLDHNSFFAEEVCLFPSVWGEWTRGPEEVCLFPSVWSDWTRTQPRKRCRVRGSGGRRTTTKRNKKRRCPRRRRERRRRRALRRKRLARRARSGGRRRRLPTSFRGGGNSGDEGDQGTGEETVRAATQAAEQESRQCPTVTPEIRSIPHLRPVWLTRVETVHSNVLGGQVKSLPVDQIRGAHLRLQSRLRNCRCLPSHPSPVPVRRKSSRAPPGPPCRDPRSEFENRAWMKDTKRAAMRVAQLSRGDGLASGGKRKAGHGGGGSGKRPAGGGKRKAGRGGGGGGKRPAGGGKRPAGGGGPDGDAKRPAGGGGGNVGGGDGGDVGDGDGGDDGGDGGDGGVTPVDVGDGDGTCSDGGGSGGVKGAADVRQAQLRQRRAEGTTRVDSTELGRWLTEPFLPCMEAFIQQNRKIADERAKDHEGTAPTTPKRPVGVGTLADLANPLFSSV